MGSVALGKTAFAGDTVQEAIGIYTVDVNLETMTGTTSLKEKRSGQESELFLLDVSSFLAPDDFTLQSISLTATTVDLTYITSHPFPAPSDLCGTASASNRADLAVTGRVLWMLDGNDGNVYFAGDGDYEANTGLVTNPDGYYAPGGMIDTAALDTNTFPYQLLVDETRDNRVGVSNGANVHGNYPGATSWTQPNYVAGLTGYGIWAQGQSSTNTISLDRPLLTSGSTFTTDVAIVVKYGDPRVGASGPEKRGNRLPCGTNAATSEPRSMIYRMPNAALDVETVFGVEDGGGGLQEGVPGNLTVSARVRDYDAGATEAATFNLAAETATDTISAGTGGAPVVDVDLPGATVTNAVLTPGGGTGDAGDEFAFSGVIDATPNDPFGTYGGMVRATDQFDANQPTDLENSHFNLGPGTPIGAPLATHFEGATLQYFTTEVLPPCDAPTGNWTITPNTIINGNTTSIVLTALTIDAGDTMFDFYADWGTGGGLVLVGNDILYTGPGPYNFVSPTYTLANPSTAETKTLAVSVNSVNCPIDSPLTNVGGTTLTVNPCGLNPNTAPTTAIGWNGSAGAWCWSGCGGMWPKDFAGFRAGQVPATSIANAGIAFQDSTNNFGIWQMNAPGTFGVGTFGVYNTANDVSLIELDSLNRMFWVETTTLTATLPNLTYMYGTAGNTTIRYVDLPATGVPAAPGGTITSPNGVIAMTTDLNNNLYTITNQNILYRYNKAAAYAVAAGYPVDLKVAPYNLTRTGSGAGEHKIAGLIYDDYAEAILIASQTLEAPPSNVYVTRIECTGARNATVSGNPNPRIFPIGSSGTQTDTVDIFIDKFNGSGASLGSGMSSQIIVSRNQNTGGNCWVQMDSSLNQDQLYNPTGWAGCMGGKPAFNSLNMGIAVYPFGVSAAGTGYTPPAGWL